jgi:hypothetical protein
MGPFDAGAQAGGTIVVAGSTSGPNPGADLQRLFFLQLRVIGATTGARGELADLLAFVANTGINPEIGLELPMDRAEEGSARCWRSTPRERSSSRADTGLPHCAGNRDLLRWSVEFRLGFMPRTPVYRLDGFVRW